MSYQVFISFKNHNSDGSPTRDSEIAAELYQCIKAQGIEVFFSNEEVQRKHRPDYGDLIDEALEESCVLILVGTSVENIQAKWVKYEWNSFKNEINSGRKDGEIISVIENITVGDLPFALRQKMVYSSDELDKAINMVMGINGVSSEENDPGHYDAVADEAAAMKARGDQFYFGLNNASQDFYEAVNWYRKAAERGNARAQFVLGCCYEYGNGVEKNLDEAVKLYRKAATHGSRYAKAALKRFQ